MNFVRWAICLVVSLDRPVIRAVGTRFWQITGKTRAEVESPAQFLDLQLS